MRCCLRGARSRANSAVGGAGIAQGEKPIDYINTHGTSTPVGDAKELAAIKRTFEPLGCQPARPSSSLLLLLRPRWRLGAGLPVLGCRKRTAGRVCVSELMRVPTLWTGTRYSPHVGSTKSLSGHSLAAAGVQEVMPPLPDVGVLLPLSPSL